jgi:ribosome-binding protein aMBF1 (putative translation factor)
MPIRDPALKRLGENIRKKRESRALSQETLAEQADLCATVARMFGQAITQELT